MLEKIDLTKKMDKKEFRERFDDLFPKIALLQRECKSLGIPVMIVFEGIGASGKGTLINRMIQPLDPRGFQVFAINGESDEEQLRPFLWRFWTKTPEKGRIAIFDRSWYRRVVQDLFDGITKKSQVTEAFDEINSFEKVLTDEGTLIIKFFLHISKKEQKKRFQFLLGNKETAWRVTEADKKRNKEYEAYQKINEEMLENTDTKYAPWTIIEAQDRNFATIKILATLQESLSAQVEKVKNSKNQPKEETFVPDEKYSSLKSSTLGTVNPDMEMTKEEYRQQLEYLQNRLSILHSELYSRRIPVVLAFEGWDAGGKGGTIKRLTQALDPRGYAVNPTAAPNDIEKAHHYLWRFWNQVPKAGHIAIFDRTWYGRVMVERIEGFCTKESYQRAYKEINEMEEAWTNFGTIVIKFWLQISKEEQLRRFEERQNTPEKQWKITEEDWRNREKWDAYEEAVDELLIRTSTLDAPWVIVEANSKYHARIKVLQTVVHTLEEQLKKQKK